MDDPYLQPIRGNTRETVIQDAIPKTQNMIADMEAVKANMNCEAGKIALKNIIAMLDGKN